MTSSQEAPSQCEVHIFLGGTLDHTTTEAYAVLVFIIVVSVIACPITTVLNALVIIAVKTKPRLQTMSNIAIACLATTDGIMGVIGQPLSIVAWVASMMLGKTSSAYCLLIVLSSNVIRVLAMASLFLLALINVERYIAIKHSLEYITIVTKVRLIRSSAVLWIITLFFTVPLAIIDNTIYLTVSNISVSFCITVIIFCQIVLYRETRRHEIQIAAQQVSVEAREKFVKDQKALKMTTTVLFFLVLSYSPIIIVRILIVNNVIKSVNLVYIAFLQQPWQQFSTRLLTLLFTVLE